MARSIAVSLSLFIACGSHGNDTHADAGSTSATACYSPDANLHLAETSAAVGCACDNEAAVCIAGTALICPIGGGRWKVYADGPCAPSDAGCAAVFPSVAACLAEYITCRQSGDSFCGSSKR
jgi:hypothetical protein